MGHVSNEKMTANGDGKMAQSGEFFCDFQPVKNDGSPALGSNHGFWNRQSGNLFLLLANQRPDVIDLLRDVAYCAANVINLFGVTNTLIPNLKLLDSIHINWT